MPLILPDTVPINVSVDRNGTLVASEPAVNFIEGSNMDLHVVDNPAANRIDVTASVVVTSYNAAVLASAPSSYYHLDESTGTVATDVNSLVNGTYIGAPTLLSPSLITTGGGHSVNFASDSQGINFGNVAYPFSGTTRFTLECWINLASVRSDGLRQGLWARTFIASGQENGWRVLVWGDFATSTFYVSAARVVAGVEIAASSAAQSFLVGTTYQVGITYDGTNTRLYQNANLLATSATDTRSIPTGTANLVFGNTSALGGSGQLGLYGLGDELAIYSGRALPQSELLAHVGAGD
jgi:hypothetical protein